MTSPTVAPIIRNMPCSRLTTISVRGDVAHLEVGIHGDADVAQRAGERRRIGGAHADADARRIEIAKRGRRDRRAGQERPGSPENRERRRRSRASARVPCATLSSVASRLRPTYLMRRPSGLAVPKTVSASVRLTTT